ncbi:MAG: hypothetical protein NTZ49_05395, partial [Candidatus Parcubacteria bacterium]|nr:hypothetical protein [Candidatus Parcubacteria bacterium]
EDPLILASSQDGIISSKLFCLPSTEPRSGSGAEVLRRGEQHFKNSNQGGEMETWKMFKKLWSVVPRDCRFALIEEFIFNPNALRQRFENEVEFQEALASRWTNV